MTPVQHTPIMIQLHIARRVGDATEYLVLRRAENEPVYPNCWQVVTGGIDPGETAVQAALREMREETGLLPTTMWAVPYVAAFYSVKRDQVLNVPVFAAVIDDLQSVTLSDEHQDFEWLGLEAALDRLIFPTHKEGTTYVHRYILNAEGDVPFPQVYNSMTGAADRPQINDA